jgi:hypothetical protein
VTQAMECLPRKHEAMISNPLVLLEKNAWDWVIDKEQRFIYDGSGGWEI